jgi:dTDP-4-amino-4,6-dideoxygalactose transaminase
MICLANPAAQYFALREEIDAAVQAVLRGNRYVLGPEVEQFEQEFAAYCGCIHGVGVANGTDAIELALRGLGVGPGDEVITVSHTAVATVAAIEAAGAIPVLVDVDPVHYTLDPSLLAGLLSPRTKAVVAVHLYGQPADLDAIGRCCRERGLALVEDVAHAHGARWQGRRVGSFGQVACFSCYPTKNLGAIGDGGIVTTSDSALAARIRVLREYGWEQRYISKLAGQNSRLDELQAAILRVKLRHLDRANESRRLLAAHYRRLLAGCAHVRAPETRPGSEHVFHLFVVRADRRDALLAHLKSRDIHAGIHYPVPIHLQPAYRGRIRCSAMPVTEALAGSLLSLPLYPELTVDEVAVVAAAIAEFEA